LAKIAVGTVKPAGICVVPHGEEAKFLAPLPVEVIPGVGKKTENLLKKKGYQVIADLQQLSQEQIVHLLGAHGNWLFSVVQGGGSDSLAAEHSRKSISREETFGTDLSDWAELERVLQNLVEDVCAGLREEGSLARTIGLKLRYADFETITRSHTVQATNDDPVVFTIVRDLFRRAYHGRKPVRLLGVHLSQLTQGEQLEFTFNAHEEGRGKLLHAVDAIRSKYGDRIIHIGRV
jgi:DNA polymerase-4